MKWSLIVAYIFIGLVDFVIGNNKNIRDRKVDWHGQNKSKSEVTQFDKGLNRNKDGNQKSINNLNKDSSKDHEDDWNEEYRYYTDNKKYRDFSLPKDKPFYTEEEIKRLDKLYGYTGPTANDEPENLLRPCALDDWQCIRNYFAVNSDCTPTYGPIPDPFNLDILTIFYSAVNMTITFPDIVARGLSSARVNTFYVNKKTGNLVFAIDVQNLNLTSQRAYFRYRRTAKESIILTDSATVNFQTATFTAVIPKIPHLDLDLADIHVYIQDGSPDYVFGPGAANSTDPDVITAVAQLPAMLPYIIREGLLFISQQLTTIFIQKNICDFGLKIIST